MKAVSITELTGPENVALTDVDRPTPGPHQTTIVIDSTRI